MEKHVYLVRHGQSRENETRIIHGREAPLTSFGKEQAQTVAGRLARLRVDALVTSHFLRARETAQIIGAHLHLPHEEHEIFGEEGAPSHLHGKAYDDPDVQAHHEALYAAPEPDFRNGDHETLAELKERAEACLAFLEAHPATRIAVITHLRFLRVLVGVLLFGDEYTKAHFNSLWRHVEAGNTGLTYIRYDDEKKRWKLVTWNDQSHLG